MEKFSRFVESCVLVLQGDLARFLRENWRSIDTKDYELLIALLVCRLFQIKQKRPFHIGLPIILPTNKMENIYSYDNVKKTLRDRLNEKSPVDFFLIDEKHLRQIRKDSLRVRPKSKGAAAQVKRVAIKSQGDITKEIINFLKKKIVSKYSPLEVTLILFIGEHISYNYWNLNNVYKYIFSIRSKFPFTEVFVVGISPEEVMFGQIWPIPHIEVYKYAHVLGDVGDRNTALKYLSLLKIRIGQLLKISPPVRSILSFSPDLASAQTQTNH